MRVLLTGATGVVGRATARELLARGHTVSAFGQGAERARRLHLLGVTPLDVDLYDAPRLPSIMRDVDAVLHLATRIPPLWQMSKKNAWAENDRLRTLATGLLVDAALTAATKLFVLHGITFIYVDRGDAWIDEACAVDTGGTLGSMLAAEAHVQRFTAAGRVGITLRNGLFYGAECQSVTEALQLAKRGFSTTIGPPGSYFTSAHTDDVASATAAALAAPAGIYNVCDDEPLTRAEHCAAFERAFGLKKLWRVPSWLAAIGGGKAARTIMRSQRVSNQRFKDATGWRPKFPSAREGWPAIARAYGK